MEVGKKNRTGMGSGRKEGSIWPLNYSPNAHALSALLSCPLSGSSSRRNPPFVAFPWLVVCVC